MRLVMLVRESDSDEIQDTAASIQAGLEEFGATLKVDSREIPIYEAAALGVARAALASASAQVVFWRKNNTLYFFVPALDAQRLLVRPIHSGVDEHVAGAISVIVQRTVQTLLSGETRPVVGDENGDDSESSVEPEDSKAPKPPLFRVMPTIASPRQREDPLVENKQDIPDSTETTETMIETEDSSVESEKGDAVSGEAEPLQDGKTQQKTSTAPPKETTSLQLWGESAYRVEGIASGIGAIHSGVLGIGGEATRVQWGIDYTLLQPISIELNHMNGTLIISRHPIRLSVRYLYGLFGRWRLWGGAALEFDLMRKKSRTDDSDIATSPDGVDLQTSLSPSFGALFRLVGLLFASVQVGVRIVVDKTLYRARTSPDSAPDTVFSPWRAQPYFCAGLLITFF